MRTALIAFVAVLSACQQSSGPLFLEDEIGSLELDKYADLVVWDTDLYEASPEAIKEMSALLTLVEGEVVYRSDDF